MQTTNIDLIIIFVRKFYNILEVAAFILISNTHSFEHRRGFVTDDYRVQMQQNDRYQQPTLHEAVTAQPLAAAVGDSKPYFYDLEVRLHHTCVLIV